MLTVCAGLSVKLKPRSIIIYQIPPPRAKTASETREAITVFRDNIFFNILRFLPSNNLIYHNKQPAYCKFKLKLSSLYNHLIKKLPRALRSAIIKVKVQQGLVLISSYCTADTERPGVRIIRPVFFSFNYSAAENVLFDLRTRDAANRGTCPARRYINGSSAAARKKLIRQCDRKCSPRSI